MDPGPGVLAGMAEKTIKMEICAPVAFELTVEVPDDPNDEVEITRVVMAAIQQSWTPLSIAEHMGDDDFTYMDDAARPDSKTS